MFLNKNKTLNYNIFYLHFEDFFQFRGIFIDLVGLKYRILFKLNFMKHFFDIQLIQHILLDIYLLSFLYTMKIRLNFLTSKQIVIFEKQEFVLSIHFKTFAFLIVSIKQLSIVVTLKICLDVRTRKLLYFIKLTNDLFDLILINYAVY